MIYRFSIAVLVAYSGVFGCSKPEPPVATGSTPTRDAWLAAERVVVFDARDEGSPAALGHLLGPGAVHGVGTLAQLGGSVTFDDGVLWVAVQASGPPRLPVFETRQVHPGESYAGMAEWLAVAQVPSWRTSPASSTTTERDLIRQVISVGGAHTEGPIPFRIEGNLESAVIRPTCAPSAGAPSHHLKQIRGHLIGVLLDDAARIHVHLTSENPRMTGHVTSVQLGAGARVMRAGRGGGPTPDFGSIPSK